MGFGQIWFEEVETWPESRFATVRIECPVFTPSGWRRVSGASWRLMLTWFTVATVNSRFW